MYLNPRLDEGHILDLYRDAAYYQSDVLGQGYDEYLERREIWLRTFARRLREIARFKAAGRVLDVGCGSGFFMETAAHRGFETWGVDPSDYAVERARLIFGERVLHGTITDLKGSNLKFDLIVTFDTFEHVYQPLAFLEAAHDLLQPGGVLAITTPDPTSLLARVSGRRWVSFKIPEHVFYWSPTTLRTALSRWFDVLEIRRAGQYATLGFVVRRLLGLEAARSDIGNKLLSALNHASLYVNNGSMTVIAARR